MNKMMKQIGFGGKGKGKKKRLNTAMLKGMSNFGGGLPGGGGPSGFAGF